MMKSLIATALLLVLSAAHQATAATLLLKYDVNNPNSWNGSQLVDLQSFGTNLVPSTASGSIAPQYVASGAATTLLAPGGKMIRDRAYMDFQDLGYITGSGHGPDALNNPHYAPGCATCGNDSVQGFSMEGFFYFDSSTFTAETNTGIGFNQGTSLEVQMIRNQGSSLNLHSQTTYDTSSNGSGLLAIDQNLNSLIPKDRWFHFIKVHDADPDNNPLTDDGQVRYYIDGQLMSAFTAAFDTALDTDNVGGNAQRYHNRGENFGAFGSSVREMRGLGFSMLGFYQGALTDAEALAAFESVAFQNAIPEPATGLFVALGLLSLIKRRRRQG